MNQLDFFLQIISEFFPISSSLFLKILNFNDNGLFHIFSGIFFIIIFFQDIINLKKLEIVKYFLINIPSIVIGLFFKPINETFPYEIITNIFMAGILYLVVRKYIKNNYLQNKNKVLSIKDSIILGLILSINGFFSGMSRLGTCLTYLLFKKYSFNKSYKISLISSIPIVIGKPFYLILKNPLLYEELRHFLSSNYFTIFIGLILSILIYIYIISKIKINFLKNFVIFRICFFVFFFIKNYINIKY
jgi:undecaprenyl pyrophosphate phosphatase UppP